MSDVKDIHTNWIRASGTSIYLFALTGLFATSYGQYYFSWDLPYFPLFFTSPLSFKNYIKAKFVFILLMTLLPALILVPLLLLTHSSITVYYLSFLLYNAGTAPLIVIYIALFNYKRIDINSKGAFSNYEGVGKSNLIIGLLLCITPVAGLIFALSINSFKWYYLMLFFTGLVNIILLPFWEKKLTSHFLRNKYKFLFHLAKDND